MLGNNLAYNIKMLLFRFDRTPLATGMLFAGKVHLGRTKSHTIVASSGHFNNRFIAKSIQSREAALHSR